MTTTDPEKFAPYPIVTSDVTADLLARYYAVEAWQAWTRWMGTRGTAKSEVDRIVREADLVTALNAFAVVHLLRNVQIYAHGQADEIAKDMHAVIDEGGSVGELLYDFLRSYGIDPAAAGWKAEA